MTPAADFFGTMTVTYRVADVTGAPDRQVQGRVLLTVQGKPDAPGTPSVGSVSNQTVVLSWGTPQNNGAEITGYTVTSQNGYSKSCPATTCTLDGLKNDVEYTFRVVATNVVGDSEPSASSAPARPDQRPDMPAPPSLTFGDKQVAVAWVAPNSVGSPVLSYDLEIRPAPASGSSQVSGVTDTSYAWKGLQNGVAYQVRVRALNRAPEPSEFSTWSLQEIPATVPSAPGQPKTQRLDPVGSQAQLKVSWDAPEANGDTIAAYQLQVVRGGAVERTLDVRPAATSATLALDTSTTEYSFRVAAINKAGTGAFSADSAPRRAFVAPGKPTGVTATPGDNRVTLSYQAAPGNGAAASEVHYEYSIGGAAWRQDWVSGENVIGNGQVANNGTYTVRVRAYTQLDGVRYDGDPSDPTGEVQPYGPVGKPGAGASASGTAITYSWSPPGRNGRDITRLEISIDGGGWENVGASSGNRTVGYGYSETHTIRVRAFDAANQQSEEASAKDTTVAPPPPPAVSGISKGTEIPCTINGQQARCNYVHVTLNNGYTGNLSVCADQKVNPNGAWGWWDNNTHCYTSYFTNGAADSKFFLKTNNNGTYTIRISIDGYASKEQSIW